MKSKFLLIALAMLLISVVAQAGVVVVSDPGQAPSGRLITTGDIVPFVKVSLKARKFSGEVFLTVNQSISCSQLDIDLFAGSMSNKLSSRGSTVIGPFTVKPGKTRDITISARVNDIRGATNGSPVPVTLNLVEVEGPPGTKLAGILPLQGTTYVVDPEMVQGRITEIQVFLNYEGSPLDTNGVHWDLVSLSVRADPLRLYQVQYSEDMVSWAPISQLFGGSNDKIRPGSGGTFRAHYFMRLPPRCHYRLESFSAP